MKIYNIENAQQTVVRFEVLKYWLEFISVLTAGLSIFISGFHYAWSSPTLPKLFAEDSHIPITSDQGSWIAVTPLLGSVPGAIISSFIGDILGRKRAIILTCPIYFTAWIFIGTATNIEVLVIGRFLVGIADGIAFTTVPIYICEIASSKIRGALASMVPILLLIGMLTINSVAPFLDIQTMAFCSAIIPIIQVCVFIWMPESPYVLLMKEKYNDAKESLIRLRRTTDVDLELEELKAAIKRQTSEKSRHIDLFLIKSNRKALSITVGLRSFQQMAGASAFILYTQTLFREAGANFSPVISSAIFFIIQFIMCILTTSIVDKLGRRPLLLFSSIGCAIMLTLEGVYFFIRDSTDIDTTSVTWVPIMIMFIYIFIYSCGLSTVPMVMLGEMFPANIKTVGLAFMDIYFSLLAAFSAKLYQITSDTYGSYVPFFIFAVSTFCSIVFVYFRVPETKGRTLEEIQLWMKKDKYSVIVDKTSKLPS